MKKILIVAMLMVSAKAFAQTYPITGINILLPSSPDAAVAKWAGGTFAIEAVSQPVNRRVNPALAESRILVIIKKAGAIACGDYTASTAPAARFTNVKMIWNGSSATALLGKGCTLPAGNYTLSVQFFGNLNGKQVALSDDYTKPFTIKENNQQVLKVNDRRPAAEKLQKTEPSKIPLYYPLSTTYPGAFADVRDTLYVQLETGRLSAPGQITYTLKNTITNKTSPLSAVKIIPRQGVIRIALPLQNSVVAPGQTGLLTLGDYKKYYYISFKRN